MMHEADNIFKSMKDIKFEDTVSHQCGVTMNDSVEARAIATVMSRHDHTTVTRVQAGHDQPRTEPVNRALPRSGTALPRAQRAQGQHESTLLSRQPRACKASVLCISLWMV